jgi:NAD(P)-dependent dehydrogenase (short-subunit alcohol dehydrogenase family)
MTDIPYRTALIVGAGSGISASFARALGKAGLRVGVAARNRDKLAALAAETGAETFVVDASIPTDVARLFAEADDRLGGPEVVLYNAAARAPGPIAELDPEAVRKAVEIGAFGAFLMVREAARRMIPRGRGAILLTGASASLKGYPLSAAFAMAKFALRGLAQSVGRELGPKGIHVAHFVIDGGVRSTQRPDPVERPDSTIDPDAIAQTYVDILRQPRSAWSFEVELRPWVETEGVLVATASQILTAGGAASRA